MAKRGRPLGSRSWQRNPNNLAAHFAGGLMEFWLADVGAPGMKQMLAAKSPRIDLLLEQCWRERDNTERKTVPVSIKRKLCRIGIEHTVALYPNLAFRPSLEKVEEIVSRRAPRNTLRRTAPQRKLRK